MDKQLANNKRIVTEFADMIINQRRPEEAVSKYLGDPYIQHEPGVGDGAANCLRLHQEMLKENPHMRLEVKRMIAEGDLVAVHLHLIRNEGDRGIATIDIFRLKNNKLAEHWNVIQEVPESSGNDNTMF